MLKIVERRSVHDYKYHKGHVEYTYSDLIIDNVYDAPQHNDEVKDVPRITKVVLKYIV